MKAVLAIGAVLFALFIVMAVLGRATQQSPSSAPATAGLDESRRFEKVNMPPPDNNGYRSFCSEKWTKRGEPDRGMIAFCIEGEENGHRELETLVARNANIPFLNAVVEAAIQKWTQRGARQDSMVAHTVKGEIDGYLDLEYESRQPGFNQSKAASCSAKWGIQYSMVVYCYKGH